MTISQRLLIACTLVLAHAATQAQMPADAPGTKDHPVLSRYAGSWLVGEEQRGFDELVVPSGAGSTARLEGAVTRLYYIGPAGRGLAEVQRNYEDALAKAGAKRVDACAGATCGDRKFGVFAPTPKVIATGSLEGWGAKSLTDEFQASGERRYWYGTLAAGGRTLHVAVVSAPSSIHALKDKHVATLVQIVEPKAMDGGMVTVDAAAMGKGLQAQGRVALYGVFFDTGKADIKPESKPQLDEMAKLLQGQPALRVFVVGHTDNQGALDANLALSKARAQAVVDALVKQYKIAANRLGSAGIANYAPLNGNTDEAARALNRRVELVLQ